MYGILEGAQETWTMAGIGTRFTIERVMIGNYLPKVVRACALLDPHALHFCLQDYLATKCTSSRKLELK